jgi:hypothetical protein
MEGSIYSDAESLALIENGGVFPSSHSERMTDEERRLANTVVITTWLADEHPLEAMTRRERVTLVRITSDAGEIIDAYSHGDAFDITKKYHASCVLEDDSLIADWTQSLWKKASVQAVTQSLELLRNVNPANVQVAAANYHNGTQISDLSLE